MHHRSGSGTQPGDRVNLVDAATVCWWEGASPHDLRRHDLSPDRQGHLWPAWVDAADAWHLGL
ncbi:MAG: hypothetical protein JXC32_15260, partial [Anaerolineae bacterium]|nr:hypothetical protein [Anaerolineae bacterium]